MGSDIRGDIPLSCQCSESRDRLSGFERRCLHQRLNECEQKLRQALMGINEAKAKTHGAPELVDIGQELAQAESHLVRALYVASAGETP